MVAALFEPPMTTDSGFIEVDNSHWEQRWNGDNQYDVWVEQINRRWVGRTYSETVGPSWDDAFNAWNEEYIKRWGKTINRRWNADPDAMAAKLLIDSEYLRLVSDYNLSHKSKVKVNTAILGVDVQPNRFEPDIKTGSFFSQIAPFIALGLAFAGIPAYLGTAIMGVEAAAAYPLAAQALGNAAIGTVINGGNVEKAVTSAAIGFAGGYVGNFAGTGLNSEALGRVAGSVTTAALKNQNIGVAALTSSIGLLDTTDGQMDYTDTLDDTYFTGSSDTSDFFDYSTGNYVDVAAIDTLEIADTFYDDINSVSVDYVDLGENDSIEIDQYLNIVDQNGEVVLTADEVKTIAEQNPGNETKAVTTAVATATGKDGFDLKTVESIVKLVGTVVATVKGVSPGARRTSVLQQQVGVPVRQPDGSTITRNANGTQTIVGVDGTVRTIPINGISPGGAGISNQALLLGGAALAAFFILRK